MRLAIMQPYFFPYIGYWQLIHAVDRFVIYDDVNYIKGGWVNRNRLLINGEPSYVTAPLHHASPNRRICDISLQSSLVWKDRMIKSIEYTYRKSPWFSEVFPVVEKLIRHETDNLSGYLAHQIQSIALFMGINTEFVLTSRCYANNNLSGQDRVLDICKREQATTYINSQGGQSLYDTETFRSAGINLRFLVMHPVPYKQRSAGFVPYLSIIDTLMEIGPGGMRKHIESFELIMGETVHAR
jgi:hypothetical protein